MRAFGPTQTIISAAASDCIEANLDSLSEGYPEYEVC
jgi:hypothetical protein